MIQCERCGKKMMFSIQSKKLSIDVKNNGFFGAFTTTREYTLCPECRDLANSMIKKFINEIKTFENPLSNGPYIIGQDFNTKDWWIYDDDTERKLAEKFDTYEDAYAHTDKLIKEKGDQNGSE